MQYQRAIIFANGIFTEAAFPTVTADTLIIAADGGTSHCLKARILPQVILGDFDSLDSDIILRLEKENITIVRFPAQKNETDLELAISYAQDKGIKDIIIYGALGSRWDMSLSNLLILAHPAFQTIRISLRDSQTEIFLIRSGVTHEFQANSGDVISLIPIQGDVRGIFTEGLLYPLQNETLVFGATRGVSNEMIDSTAHISICEGQLLCFITHSVKDGNK